MDWLIKGAGKRRDVVVFGGRLSEELADAVADVIPQVPGHHHHEEAEHQDDAGYEHHYDGQGCAVPGGRGKSMKLRFSPTLGECRLSSIMQKCRYTS